MKCWKGLKNKGNISIFVAICLSGIIFLNFILIDSSRIMTAKANVKEKLLLATKSVMSSYNSKLFNDYGLIAISGDREVITEIDYFFNGYNGLIRDNNTIEILQGYLNGISGKFNKNLGDVNILNKQIIDIMSYKTPANLLETILDSLEIIETGTNSGKSQDLYTTACNNFEILTSNVENLRRTVEGFSNSDIFCVNGFNNSKVTDLLIIEISSLALTINSDDSSREKAIASCLKLNNEYKTYAELNRVALSQITEINTLIDVVKGDIKNIEDWLETNKNEDQYYTKMSKLLDELKNKIDKYSFSENLEELNTNLSILENHVNKTSELYNYLKSEDIIFSKSIIDSYLENSDINNLNLDIKIFNYNISVDTSLKNNAPDVNQEPDTSAVTNDIKSNINISDDIYSQLPSQTKSDTSLKKENETQLNNVLVDDYILSYFNSYIDNNSSNYFTSEVEYILSGEKSEKNNIDNVMMEIYFIRLGLNLVHIVCDDSKRQMATAMGQAIAGTTLGLGGPVYATIIMGIWAAGESLIDIKDLKDGKEVPLYKTKEDWKLSIYGIKNTFTEKEKTSSVLSFNYEGYLRLLLFTTSQEVKLKRTMDLIQLNLTKFYNSKFNINDYYIGLNVQCNFVVPTNIKEIYIKEDVYVEY